MRSGFRTLLVALMFVTALCSCSNKWGIDGENPLGTFEALKVKLSESEFAERDAEGNFLGKGEPHSFATAKDPESKISVVVEGGKVIGVYGQFVDERASRGKFFMMALWEEVSGAPAPALDIIKAGTARSEPIWGADYSGEAAAGRIISVAQTYYRVYIVKKDYEDVLKKF
jgi:hypothetical protein